MPDYFHQARHENVFWHDETAFNCKKSKIKKTYWVNIIIYQQMSHLHSSTDVLSLNAGQDDLVILLYIYKLNKLFSVSFI